MLFFCSSSVDPFIELLTIFKYRSFCLELESLYSGLTFYNLFHDIIHCAFACFVQKDIQITIIVITIENIKE